LDSLGGIGTFQRATANPNKKISWPRFLQFVSAIPPCPRSPDSLGDPDQSGEQQQYSTHSDFRKDNVRPRSGQWFMWQPIPPGWRWWPGRGNGIRTPSRRGPRPGRPYFGGRIIQGGTQSGRSQAERGLCAMRAGLNTGELIAVRCSNPLCTPSFCDESHSAATKNLDRLRTKVFRAIFPRRAGHRCVRRRLHLLSARRGCVRRARDFTGCGRAH
jgi:hypothetical protein